MTTISYPSPRREEDENARGGPIAALLIAIPVSLLLWGAAVFALLNLIR